MPQDKEDKRKLLVQRLAELKKQHKIAGQGAPNPKEAKERRLANESKTAELEKELNVDKEGRAKPELKQRDSSAQERLRRRQSMLEQLKKEAN